MKVKYLSMKEILQRTSCCMRIRNGNLLYLLCCRLSRRLDNLFKPCNVFQYNEFGDNFIRAKDVYNFHLNKNNYFKEIYYDCFGSHSHEIRL